jgi:HAMP domain-containing protein
LRVFGDRSLRVKLILGFLTITMLSVGAVAFSSDHTIRSELTTNVGRSLKSQAATMALAVGDLLARQLDTLQGFAFNQVIQDQVAEIGAAYSGTPATNQAQLNALNQQWAAARTTDPLVQDRLNNVVASELKEYRSTFPDNMGMFVTDKYGALAAATSRTAAYYFADQDWWQAAWNNGQGAVYIGQPAFDQNTQSFALPIAVPIYGHGTREVVGILSTSYRPSKLIRLVNNLRGGALGHPQLLLNDGRFVTPDNKLASLEPGTLAQLQPADADYVELTYQGEPSFVSQAPVTAITGEPAIAKLRWRLAVYQARAESLAPVDRVTQLTLFISLIALLVAGVLALGLAQVMSTPIRRLIQAVQQIAAGDVHVTIPVTSRDEMGVLTQAFNQMTNEVAAARQRRARRRVLLAVVVGLDQFDVRSDLFGMRVAADGTKIDPMGFAFSASPAAESWPNVSAGSGLTTVAVRPIGRKGRCRNRLEPPTPQRTPHPA